MIKNLSKKSQDVIEKIFKNKFFIQELQTEEIKNIPLIIYDDLFEQNIKEKEFMIKNFFFSMPQNIRLRTDILFGFLYNRDYEEIGKNLFKKISKKEHLVIKKMLTKFIKENKETKIYFENNCKYNFKNVLKMLEIIEHKKNNDNSTVKIQAKEIKSENSILMNDIEDNLSRAIKLINNNQREYNLKYSYNGTFEKEYNQREEEDSYLFDYITAIGNILFSFNNLLLNLTYKYSRKSGVSHLINKNDDYKIKMESLKNKYKKIFEIDKNYDNFLKEQKERYFQNFLIIDNKKFTHEESMQNILINHTKERLSNKSNNDYFTEQKEHLKKDLLGVVKKISKNDIYIFLNKSVKDIYEIFYEETKQQIKDNPNINQKGYYINILINHLNKQLNDFKIEYETINKKSNGLFCLDDDLFNKKLNDNDITKLVKFFIKNNLVPQKFLRIFNLYEVMFRHQYAHGCNDYFKNALQTHRKAKFSSIDENNLQFTTTIYRFNCNLKTYKSEYEKNLYYFYNKKYLIKQENFRIELTKFNAEELTKEKNDTRFYCEINNHLFNTYFNEEKKELIFPFQKSNNIDTLKNELNFLDNEEDKKEINNKIKMIEDITKQFKIENSHLDDLDNYIFFDDYEEISLSYLIDNIVSFLNYYYKN